MAFRSLYTFLLLVYFIGHGNEALSDEQELEISISGTNSQKWYLKRGSDTLSAQLAILPLGSIENHGPHLPVGTDLLLAEKFTIEAARSLNNVVILPSSPYGASFEHANRDGTIAIDDDVLNGLWKQIISALVQQGFRKILLINAHGGQTPNVEIAIRQTRFHHNILAVSFNVQAAMTEAWLSINREEKCDISESEYGIHGGLIETSVMMYICPDLVHESKITNFQPLWNVTRSMLKPHTAKVSYGWRSEDLCELGAVGDATKASKHLGEQIFVNTRDMIRTLILEILDADDNILKKSEL